jgi:Amt family ammonium transporter
VGGTLGALVTGFLATASVNSNLTGAYATKNGLAKLVTDGGLWLEQVKAISITLVLSILATVVIAYIVKALVGLRPTPEAESQGLDITDHREEGYIN